MPEKPPFDSSEEPTLVPEPEKTRVPNQKELDTIMVRERGMIVPPATERVSEEKVDEFAFTIRELLGDAAFLETESGVDMSDLYLMLAYHIVKRHLDVFAHVQKSSDIEIQLPEKSPEFDMSAPMLYVITPNDRLEITQREVVAAQLTLKK